MPKSGKTVQNLDLRGEKSENLSKIEIPMNEVHKTAVVECGDGISESPVSKIKLSRELRPSPITPKKRNDILGI
jgi:hypothetical protein